MDFLFLFQLRMKLMHAALRAIHLISVGISFQNQLFSFRITREHFNISSFNFCELGHFIHWNEYRNKVCTKRDKVRSFGAAIAAGLLKNSEQLNRQYLETITVSWVEKGSLISAVLVHTILYLGTANIHYWQSQKTSFFCSESKKSSPCHSTKTADVITHFYSL